MNFICSSTHNLFSSSYHVHCQDRTNTVNECITCSRSGPDFKTARQSLKQRGQYNYTEYSKVISRLFQDHFTVVSSHFGILLSSFRIYFRIISKLFFNVIPGPFQCYFKVIRSSFPYHFNVILRSRSYQDHFKVISRSFQYCFEFVLRLF